MLKVRLARYGKRNDPIYRIVVTEEGAKAVGQATQVVGSWHPKKDRIEINKKEVEKWVAKGAIVTPAVKSLMK